MAWSLWVCLIVLWIWQIKFLQSILEFHALPPELLTLSLTVHFLIYCDNFQVYTTVLEFLKVVSDPTVCLCLIYTILAKKFNYGWSCLFILLLFISCIFYNTIDHEVMYILHSQKHQVIFSSWVTSNGSKVIIWSRSSRTFFIQMVRDIKSLQNGRTCCYSTCSVFREHTLPLWRCNIKLGLMVP